VLRFSESTQATIDRIHYSLIAIMGGIASWYGVRLCVLNNTLVTPGLSLPLSLLYASCAIGGLLLVVFALSMIANPPPPRSDGLH
jgi:TRAP-type C4-dicarboxylate transport system permease small subunit